MGVAHRALLMECCSRGIAHRVLRTGYCSRDIARGGHGEHGGFFNSSSDGDRFLFLPIVTMDCPTILINMPQSILRGHRALRAQSLTDLQRGIPGPSKISFGTHAATPEAGLSFRADKNLDY